LNVHIELPKVIRDALQKLASEKDVQEIGQLIRAALENADLQDAHVPVELPDGDSIEIPWSEGTEDLATLTEDHLWTHLGLDKKRLPFFSEFTDPDAIIEPWTEDGEKWLASESSNREALRPRWHQLVGIYRMLQRAFEGKSVLLMDGVGIGKTFQVIGFIACLSHFHWHYDVHKKFPGAFGK
jgi:hypothetical protein